MAVGSSTPSTLRDRRNRPLGVLRLSLTARCNLACPYCLPDGLEPPGLLNTAERLVLVAALQPLGLQTLRLTGGEPLLHPHVEELIHEARALGVEEIALTSNGTLLSAERAQHLRNAGLSRLTLSLDGTTGASVARMAGLTNADAGTNALNRVLAAIEHGKRAGFSASRGELKLNAVIQRGANDDQLVPLAALARQHGVELRLIEFMDVGSRNGWQLDAVVPAAEMVERIGYHWPLEPVGRDPHGTATRWHYRDGSGALSVVASVSAPFCGDCNRLRITADGMAYTCLFATPESGVDLRPWLRPSLQPEALTAALRRLWMDRSDRYSEERAERRAQGGVPPAEMAYLGG
jgi:cyclic pyranopterin phosphate synthase